MTDRFITHFENNEANRSQAILLELMTILGKYRKDLYLVGGWAPYYLLKMFQKPDNDFAMAERSTEFQNLTNLEIKGRTGNKRI